MSDKAQLDRIERMLEAIAKKLGLTGVTSKPSSEQPKTSFTEEELNQIEWSDNDWGQWTFARNKDGSPSEDPIVTRLADTLKPGPLRAFGYEYKLSGNEKQFINRRRKQ